MLLIELPLKIQLIFEIAKLNIFKTNLTFNGNNYLASTLQCITVVRW